MFHTVSEEMIFKDILPFLHFGCHVNKTASHAPCPATAMYQASDINVPNVKSKGSCIVPMHFCSIRAENNLKLNMKRSNKQLFQNSKRKTKKSKLKMQQKVIKNNFRIRIKTICISSDHPKSVCKISKRSA